MIIHLPFPDATLFPNRIRGSFRKTVAAKQAARDAGHMLARLSGTMKGREGFIPLSLLFLTPDKRHRDTDNMLAASKWLLDGVAAGLGINDKQFKPILVDWAHGHKPGALIAAVGVTIVSSQVI
jgi:crossover junction endodeoxyribonuclease RusA